MFDVVALGELLIDFTPCSPREEEGGAQGSCFQKNAGGAPANVLVSLARQGKKTAFIGKVGEDAFGFFLEKELRQSGVDTSALLYARDAGTTLAFVELDEHGDRSFIFYRKPGADMLLLEEELPLRMIEGARVFHFGSVSMTHEPSRSATLNAAKHASEHGLLVSFDPNLRPLLWQDLAEARSVILEALPYADVLKLSEEELAFLTGSNDPEQGSRQLFEAYRTKLICVTFGPDGCYFRAGETTGRAEAYAAASIDTTAAGDSFLGGVLGRLLEAGKPIEGLSSEELVGIMRFGNASGSLATTRKGGIPSIPDLGEIHALMDRQKQSGCRR